MAPLKSKSAAISFVLLPDFAAMQIPLFLTALRCRASLPDFRPPILDFSRFGFVPEAMFDNVQDNEQERYTPCAVVRAAPAKAAMGSGMPPFVPELASQRGTRSHDAGRFA